MKNLLKTVFFAALLSVVACGDAVAEKEITVAAATPTSESMIKEIPEPVVAEADTKTIEVVPVKKKEKIRTDGTKTKPIKKEIEQVAPSVKAKVEKTVAKEALPPTKEIVEEKTATTSKITKEEVSAKEEVVVAEPKPASKKEEVKAEPKAFSHAAWNTLAQKYISSAGKVNYKGFKADIVAFDTYLKSLADNPVQSSWSRDKKMAYWINAYNAFTIKLIVDNYPVKSITDLEGGKPWDKKWIKLGDKIYSLNNIEHDILRPTYKDARIHFAVNCAAKSCPPVWNKAWTADNLNGQLERSAKAFINNTKYNAVSSRKVSISKIFEWYAVDFGNIVDYLNKYANTKVAGGTTVTYQEYNWALNE